MTLREAVERLLAKTAVQYTYRGMGQYGCNSCGAAMHDDSHEDFVSFHKEPHSPSCPWRLVKEAFEAEAPQEEPGYGAGI